MRPSSRTSPHNFLRSGAPPGSRLAIALAASLALAGLLASCSGSKGGRGFSMPPVPVEVSEVRPQVVRDQFRAVGSIESDEIIEVVSELNAIVSSLPFAEGQPVAKGALIAHLDDREIKAAAQHAEAQREWSQSNADRAQKLFDQQLTSQQQLDDARTNLKIAEADEALAKARLAKTLIRAPFSGMIGRRRVSPGAYLKAGDVITELARVDDMKVTFTAPERYLAQLKAGSRVEVSTPALPGRTFQGSISVVDPIVDADSRTIRVVARIPNSERVLRPGMSANVAVTFSERPNSLVIPDEAVFAEGNQSFVFVVKPDSTVARAAIELGSRDSSRVEVLQGLEPGTTIVRTGHQKLFDGAHVMPIPEQAMAAGGGAAPAGAGGARGAAAPAGAKAPAGGSKSAGSAPAGSPKGGGASGSPGGAR